MDMAKWAKCAADYKPGADGKPKNPFPDVRGCEVITGADLSQSIAFSSVTHEIRCPNGKIALMSKSFLPKETVDAYRSRNNSKIPLWVEQGYIIETPGAVVDYSYILDYIEQAYAENNWKKGEVAYDRALATWLSQQLAAKGYTPADIPQGMLTLGAPTKDFRMEVYKENVIHDDPVLTFAIGNAICDTEDKNLNVMLNKKKSKEMIDPAAALMNAHVRYVVKPKISVYDTRPAGEKFFSV
jgi:phage terminase large subunit-like protein